MMGQATADSNAPQGSSSGDPAGDMNDYGEQAGLGSQMGAPRRPPIKIRADIWLVAAAMLLLAAVAMQIVLARWSPAAQPDTASTRASLRQLGRLPGLAREAVFVSADAYRALRTLKPQIAAGIQQAVHRGQDAAKQSKSPVELWARCDTELTALLQTQEAVMDLYQATARVDELTVTMLTRIDELIDALIRASGNARRARDAAGLKTVTEMLAKEASRVLIGGEIGRRAAQQIPGGVRFFLVKLQDIGTDRALQPARQQLEQSFAEFENALNQIHRLAPQLFRARDSADAIASLSEQLLVALESSAPASQRAYSQWLKWMPLLLSCMALCCLCLIYLLRRRVAGVDESPAGARAPGDDPAFEDIGALIVRIKEASRQVSTEARLAALSSQALSEVTKAQADQISDAAARMDEVASVMHRISADAQHSTSVADESTEFARQGATAVRETIQGLDEMRGQIRVASKRVKRLGESSQQIGEIVQLIDNIAEQTNILSLNAAIQASAAGDAGHGLGVVADEVHSMAERATGAARDIAELVHNIQLDAKDAVRSMELVIQEVVADARVANAAGQALQRVESASEDLTGLIAKFADRAGREAQAVIRVSERIGELKNRSTSSAPDLPAAADAIGTLTMLVRRLEESIAHIGSPQEG